MSEQHHESEALRQAVRFCASFDNSTRYFKPNQPLIFSSGRGSHVYDIDGRKYLDFNNGWSATNFGHAHPALIECLVKQAEQLDITPNMLSDRRIELSERLVRLTRLDDGVAYFDCTGSNAVELARKLVSACTGKSKVVTFQGAFHGRTIGTLSITNSSFLERYGISIQSDYYSVPFAQCASCPVGKDRLTCEVECMNALKALLDDRKDIAAVFVEPALGPGGYVFPPTKFLKRVRDLTTSYGVLLVVDEVQMGLGRCGEYFLHQKSDVQPDIIVLGKSLAGGLYPMAAVVGKREVMSILSPGAHTGSFAGSPIGCALGLKVLDLLEEPGFMDAVRQKGAILKAKLSEMASSHSHLQFDTDAEGLAFGLSFRSVGDCTAETLKERLRFQLLDRGVFLLGREGTDRICLIPSLLVSGGEIDEFVRCFEAAVEAVAQSI